MYFLPHFSPHVFLVYGMNFKINSPLSSDFGDISVISNVVWEQRIVSPLIPHNPLLCSTPCCIRGGIYILKEKHFYFHKRKKSLSPEYLQGGPKKVQNLEGLKIRAVESEFKSNPIFPILSNFLSDFIQFLSDFYPIFFNF